MRVLVVTNLYPSAERPRLGRFVHDQVEAMRALGTEVELFSFPLGSRSYLPAVRRLRRKLAGESFDLFHAHYGLCGWVASLAGAEPLVVTFHGTDVRHRTVGPLSRRLAKRIDVAAGASRSIFEREGERDGLPLTPGAAVLPCGVDLERFRELPRAEARRALGLSESGRYLLFPADPARPVKRHDRAAEVARLADAELLVGGEIDPERMPLWVNAADAVLVTSESEGFGLALLEALACRVPVLSTPVGIAPLVAGGLDGCLVASFDLESWAGFARSMLGQESIVPAGRAAAEPFSVGRMAERVLAAYEDLAAPA
ncbi:MAG: glycosyltransferase [Solirubrobacterales bacterium]|nr:glycosyltransferase [Solirubrobacterales bacterium]